MKKNYLVLVLVALAIIGLSYILIYKDNNEYNNSSNNSSKENITEPVDLYDCTSDSDCIAIGTKPGCCACNYEPVAINKKYENYWKNKEHISGCVCIADAECILTARCIDNKCNLEDS